MKLKLNLFKTLTIPTILLPIVAIASCGRDKTIKHVYTTKDEKTFTFKKDNLINSKNNQISDELKKQISIFNQNVEKVIKKYKGKTGEVIQPLIYDFSESKITSFPKQVFKIFKNPEGIVKLPIELKLNNNQLHSFNFAELPINIIRVDLSYNKLSGKIPLKDIKKDYQGIYINLKNNNYTAYDKNYLKTLGDPNSGIALVKDDQSWMNMYKPYKIFGFALFPGVDNFDETQHSLMFPRIVSKKISLSTWESVALIKYIYNMDYTRLLLSGNRIKW